MSTLFMKKNHSETASRLSKNVLLLKKSCLLIIAFFLIQHTFGQVKSGAQYNPSTSRFQAVETGFITIPDTIQTSVYWYWISDNISKEGVVHDLEAMKKVGINRAFIGNIGLDDVPYGKAKMLSDEWWAILDEALKTATG